MKLLDILLEDVETPFNEKCVMNITNNDGETISVDCEVPKTEEEKITGLMNRDSLGENSGMFYDYVDGGFWMDNVKFPIEMVFINDDKIVDIKKAKAYDKTSISPSVESNGNLEVNDGFCGDNNISVGNTIYRS
jgi:uncharacterized protein|tara:strand:+ start:1947 stop:2348 length:402 start_codon:yes stop_codon:yes gene_type:complete